MEFAIKIETPRYTLRYGTERLEITEQIGGQATLVEYLPYVQSIDSPVASIELQGAPSVPSVKISVWDAFGDINQQLKSFNYESIPVTVYYLKDKKEIVDTFSGYMTDVSSKGGLTNFTVRVHEDENFNSDTDVFTYKTFQRAQVLTPKNVELYGNWDIVEDTPWEVQAVHGPKSRLFKAANAGGTSIELRIKNNTYKPYHPTDTGGITNSPNVFGGTFVHNRVFSLIDTEPDSALFYNELYGVGSMPPQHYDGHNLAVVSWTVDTKDKPALKDGFILNAVRRQVIAYKTISLGAENRTILEGIPTSGPFRIQNRLPEHAVVAPIDARYYTGGPLEGRKVKADRIFAGANGLVPVDTTSPKISYGFIYLGMDAKDVTIEPFSGSGVEDLWMSNEVPPANESYISNTSQDLKKAKSKLFHRFDISAIIEVPGEPNNPIIVLDMHNRPFDKTEPYRLSLKWAESGAAAILGSYEIPFKLKKGTPIKLVDFKWRVGQADFHVNNVSTEDTDLLITQFYEDENAYFLDRLKGSRVDMIDNFSNMVNEFSIDGEVDYGEINNNIVNNTTGNFAVAIGSKVTLDGRDFTESVFFSLPPHTEGILPIINNADISQVVDFEALIKRPDVSSDFINNLVYQSNERPKPIFNASNGFQYPDGGSAGLYDAKNYFLSRLYRILIDPVPENPQDLGKYFPIVYGYVEKVPMVHCISKKTIESKDKNSAGDDVYIYSRHPCGVTNPYDIKIYLLDEQGREVDPLNQNADFLPSVRNEIIQSPFPNVLKDHWETGTYQRDWLRVDGVTYDTSYYNLNFIGNIYHPYHYNSEFTTVEGNSLYGIKLRGEEWNSEAGILDRRYPIRNGVGSSPLYASFSGWRDMNGEITGRMGEVIEHHADIAAHYIKTYRVQDPSFDSVDQASWQDVKSKTPKLFGSLFLNEGLIKISDLLTKINEQFGTMWYNIGSKVFFVRPDLDLVDYSKIISDGINLIEGIEEDSIGYKKSYDQIVYNYRKNWVTGDFDEKIILDKYSNHYCAQASRSKIGRETLTIDADMVNSHAVATEAVAYIAKMRASRQVNYKLSLKYVEGIEFRPGDYVPLTSVVFNLKDFPVLIKSVKKEKDIIVIEAIGFLNLI
jgi:hypothetical protein